MRNILTILLLFTCVQPCFGQPGRFEDILVKCVFYGIILILFLGYIYFWAWLTSGLTNFGCVVWLMPFFAVFLMLVGGLNLSPNWFHYTMFIGGIAMFVAFIVILNVSKKDMEEDEDK